MRLKRCMAAFLSMTVMLSMGAFDAVAAESTQRDANTGQAASAPETVYVNAYGTGERSVSFNDHWRFYLGELNGAQAPSYNDSSWKNVSLPHDYSIDQGFSTAAPAEQESGYVLGGTGWYRKAFTLTEDMRGKTISVDFDGVYMNATVYLNGTQLGTHPYGYTPFSFVLPNEILKFGGEENVLAVKVEHKQPSSRWYSGSGIYRDVNLTITNPVHVAYFGTAVTTPDIDDGTGTVNIVTSVKNDGGEERSVSVKQTVYEKGGKTPVAEGEKTAAQTVAAGAKADIAASVTVPSPKLWSTENPNLYTVRTEVFVGDTAVDSYDSDFGFRWVEFTVDNGFFLNGKNMKLRGVSMHHDQGGLGSESWRRAVERQVEMLMQMGVNAIRVTHNPASQTLIDICNEKGVLLVEEAFDCWLSGKAGNTEDYGRWFEAPIEEGNQIVDGDGCEEWAEFDVKAMVKRGKNAPSIIMWSLGNEVFQQTISTSDHGRYPEVAAQLIQWVAEEDATRYVTFGDNWFKGNESNDSNVATQTAKVFAGASQYGVPGGLPGYNYGGSGQIQNGHNKGWMVYGSETASSINSRGVYDRKTNGGDGGKGDKRLTSYDKSRVSWGHLASDGLWITMRQPFNAGEFVWTGFDYIGEPTPDNWQGTGANGTWPNIAKNSYFGIIDTAGFPKDSFYLYQSQWNDKLHTLHVLPVWNEEEIVLDGGKAEVVVYSDAPVIKLYLNGKEIGSASAVRTSTPTGGYQSYTSGTGCFDSSKASGHTSLYATFNVPYEAGKLEAKAFEADGTTEISETDGRSAVETVKSAAKLSMRADRETIAADGKDLSYITIDVTDEDGKFVNGAEPEITVSVEGEGKLLALDNGVQNDVTAYGEKTRKAGKGKLLAIVQSTEKEGSFTVKASAQGVLSAEKEVTTKTAVLGQTEKKVISYEISRNYFVKAGTDPVFPETVKVNFSDGTVETKQITWDALPADKGESYSVYGTVADLNLRVPVHVMTIGDVEKVLNYSAAIGKDAVISLPATRPAVLADGTVLGAEFPVTWDVPDNLTASAGTKTVNGTASVFEQEIPVTASVRVTLGGYKDGAEALSNVPEMYINGESSKDSAGVAEAFAKLKDDKASKTDEAWSGRGTLDFRLDTAIELKDFTLYLKDTAPTSGTMKIYSSSDNGQNWTQAACTVSNRKEDGVTVRTFTPNATVSETWFRVEFEKAVTLVELEMNTRIPTFDVGSEAALSYLKAGSHIAGAAALERGWFGVNETRLTANDVTAIGKDNASITVLPKSSDNIIRIVMESEDHAERGVYQIRLGKDNIENNNANDDSADYPYAKMNLTAPSVEKDGSAGKANDGDNSSIWHSNWGGGTGPSDLRNEAASRYLQIELEELTEINGLRYRPRPSQTNGTVTSYRIEVSATGAYYQEVAAGSWSTAVEWKLARFDTVRMKYIRLYGVETAADKAGEQNQFMAAAEVRIRCAPKELNSTNTTVTLAEETMDYTGSEIKPEPTVVYKESSQAEGVTLTKGTDYDLSYRNNIKPGTAVVAVTGKGSYAGVAEKEFTIQDAEMVITGYDKVSVTTERGVYPLLPSAVAADTNFGKQMMEVQWDTISDRLLNKFGTFKVYGSVVETKAHIAGEVTVSDVVGVRQVTAVTEKGTEPALPDKVTVYYDNGDEAERDVTWDLTGISFAEAGIVKVSGMAGKSEAEASVRITEAAEDANETPARTNLALNANGASKPKEWPRTFAYIAPSGDPVHNITDGNKSFDSTSSKKIWSDWESGKYHTNTNAAVGAADHVPFVATAFGVDGSEKNEDQKKYTVNKVSIGFMEEDGSSAHKVRLPQDYKIEYYSGNNGVIEASRISNDTSNGCSNTKGWAADNPIKAHDGWTEVEYLVKKPDVPSADNFKHMVDVEFKPVETTAVRITLIPQAENWTGLEEIEVYYIPVEKNSSFTVRSISIDGENVLGQFDEETKTLTVENKTEGRVTAEATDNASVTTLEAVNGRAKVIFIPENGDETKKEEYTINFKQTQQGDAYLISAEDDQVDLLVGEAADGAEVTFGTKTGYEFTETPVLVKSEDRTETGIAVTEKDGKYTFTMPAYPVTVKGAPSPVKYTIAYELNGGAAENRTEYTIEDRTFTLKNPTKDGFVFLGWTSESVTEPVRQMKVVMGTTGNLKFTANWREGTAFHITFDSDGGSQVEAQDVAAASGIIREPENPTKRGYTFDGWYSDEARTKRWSFDSKADGDMTLYAKWTEAPVMVNTKIVRHMGEKFEMPASINVTTTGETFDAAVTWNAEEVSALKNASEIGNYTVTGTVAELFGRTVSVTVPVSPAGIVYFVDSGADSFSGKVKIVADANELRNAVPDGAYSAAAGWGYTNDPASLEANGSGDAYATIRNFIGDVTGETLTYRFDLDAGNYNVTAGFYDPWAEYAGDNRHAKVSVTDLEGNELAVKADHHIKEKAEVTFENIALLEDGSVLLNVAPIKTGQDTDTMISFIVIQNAEAVEIPIREIVVKDSQKTVKTGNTYQIDASVRPVNTTDDKTLTYRSSNETVASVNGTGLVTAHTEGTADITISSVRTGATATVRITVTDEEIPIESVEVEETEITLPETETYTIRASVKPENTTDDKTLSYTSSNDAVASVDADGVVTAKAEGGATISISSVRPGIGAEVKVTVTERIVPIEAVTVTETEKELAVNQTYQIHASVTPEDTTDDKTLTYASSNEAVASVDSAGLVTAKAEGTADITISSVREGKTASVKITVVKDEEPVPGDNTLLANTVNEMKNIDLTKYTSVSAEEFRKALAAAEEILSNPKATQEQINAALQKLSEAKAALVEDKTQGGGGQPQPSPSQPQVPAKNSTFSIGALSYKVTKSDASKGTVAVSKLLNKKTKKIKIPATVKKDGYTFKVTEIAKNVFQKNKKITQVEIGANVSKIGAKSFYKCAKLGKITFKNKNAVKIGKQAFSGIKKTCKVTVPKKMSKKNFTKLKKGMKSAGKKISFKKK